MKIDIKFNILMMFWYSFKARINTINLEVLFIINYLKTMKKLKQYSKYLKWIPIFGMFYLKGGFKNNTEALLWMPYQLINVSLILVYVGF